MSSISAWQARRRWLAFISLKEPIIKMRYRPAMFALGDGFQTYPPVVLLKLI
jgi:hypothetical protein